ncbi:MAG: isoprenyl transferase [Flavobacteriales bacterium]|nr:isoprenyl transferase [Flavobacteriales bacterium]
MFFRGKEDLNPNNIPSHVAVIMDGNGRWAKKKGLMRIFGHKNGVKAVRETVEAAAEIGVKYLTLYAFSTENWNRPQDEVNALMDLLVDSTHSEIDTLMKNSIKLEAIGDLDSLPKSTRENLQKAIDKTRNNSRMTLILALSYSSRWEIIKAVKEIAQKCKNGDLNPDTLSESDFVNALSTSGIPDPELMIRTSGEQRISNYLLWQLAYAELYFTDVLWPDFRKDDFFKALFEYQQRERRFGKTGDQLHAETKPVPDASTYNKTA